jgi:hypothetical protein
MLIDHNALYDNEMSSYKRSILYNCILRSTSYSIKEYSEHYFPYQEDILYYASNLHS